MTICPRWTHRSNGWNRESAARGLRIMTRNPKQVTASTVLSRNYSEKAIKVLFALSGNRCAEPGCFNTIIISATGYSHEIVVGQIAHIYPAGDNGPPCNASVATDAGLSSNSAPS